MGKMPPKEKIAEALSAIADGRIAMRENEASVASSGGGKHYTVKWTDEDVFSSNDSATYWQLYPGYPIIAVLLLLGRLPLREDMAEHFAGINWTELNRKHKRKYDRALAEVLHTLEHTGVDTGAIEQYTAMLYTALEKLDITIKRGSLRPPK